MTGSCRFCAEPLERSFVDLGMSPLSNAFLKPEDLNRMERFYPLHAYLCEECYLVQLEAFESPGEIFGDYAYFSSYSDTWLAHARRFSEQAVKRFGLSGESTVVEVASNDGYLLRFFKAQEIPVLGIEPARNVAQVAIDAGINTVVDFFGVALARRLRQERGLADLLIGNNVFAHVPDLNDFVAGLKEFLKPEGVVTLEFPHLLRLIEQTQFDTIYHEHFSYFSLFTAERILRNHGLRLFDVEELPSHGGSLRVYACHADSSTHRTDSRVAALIDLERQHALDRPEGYDGFAEHVREAKRALLAFLIEVKRAEKRIAGYGAPAKGNTLLNYCGIGTDFIDFTVDRSPYKQGLYLPGSRIPIHAPEAVRQAKPDYLLILAWNIREEIMATMSYIHDWGGRFVIPIPRLEVLP